ncbi:MAG: phosphoenolpyruvate synthase, partial [Chloroflexi bacterium]|nr:phosphoenolpyruvate synthase [Chloroflexota bacterium]
MTYLLYPTSNVDPQQLGGKAKALAALAPAQLSIPAWFVLSPHAFYASLAPAQQHALAAAKESEAALAALASLALAPEIEIALQAAVTQLELDVVRSGGAVKSPTGLRLAVRSSAVDEDSAQHSFAGQLDSFLQVAPADLPARILAVWRSAFSPRLYAYRRQQGLATPPLAPAVLVQRMINAEAAGVAFSADPVRGRRQLAVVAAVRGLGDKLVAGETNADSYHVTRAGEVVEQQWQVADQPVLTAEQVRAVAALARQTEAWFDRPQDIEWAMEQGQLYLLQARPITALAPLADPDGVYNLWDNSNIVESYGGITTPLTYSFARRAYEEVYLEFCRILGVPKRTIAANRQIFTCMIGLVRGRIYYNLLNWYRVLAMLPGFKTNRQFMEQMMGVKEPLPDLIVATLDQSNWQQRLIDRGQLLGTVLGLVSNHFLLARRKRHFYQRLQKALGDQPTPLTALRADELPAYYRTLEQQLLTRWDAPLVNDFFAMIFYGVLRKLVMQWCGDLAGTLQNDL